MYEPINVNVNEYFDYYRKMFRSINQQQYIRKQKEEMKNLKPILTVKEVIDDIKELRQ